MINCSNCAIGGCNKMGATHCPAILSSQLVNNFSHKMRADYIFTMPCGLGALRFEHLSYINSRWALSYSDLGCWLSNTCNFQTFTLDRISYLCCSLQISYRFPAIKRDSLHSFQMQWTITYRSRGRCCTRIVSSSLPKFSVYTVYHFSLQ